MPNVTAKQLSEVIGVGIDKLLDQLKTAGVQVSGPDDPISDDDKIKLLESLRTSHGKTEVGGPKKITLKRKSKSELRVAGVAGRNATTKTINVEVRKKRTYVRRSDVEAEESKAQEEQVPVETDEVVETSEPEEVKVDKGEAKVDKEAEEEAARL
ncbi:MAG: translation initiation factor IF-2, partial [Gammaproteobacteria bacterium]|nr:translation initiation factor IF-2 [Gammaproteobacteria bacterium]